MRRVWAIIGLLGCGGTAAWAQNVVIQNDANGTQVSVMNRPASEAGGNSAGFHTGIAPSAQIQGIAIINGVITIDGEPVPPDARHYTSRSGKHYRIDRHSGSVDVREEE